MGCGFRICVAQKCRIKEKCKFYVSNVQEQYRIDCRDADFRQDWKRDYSCFKEKE